MVGIILYRPEKPGNVGNIIRTCMASEARLYIIGPLTFSLTTKELQRAGMDYIKESDFVLYKDFNEFIKDFKDNRYSNKVYSSFDYSKIEDDIYFMFGRESTGIPHEILKENLNKCLRIPMAISARSLNLGNSVAIVLYECLRQRKFYGLATYETIKGEDFLINETKND